MSPVKFKHVQTQSSCFINDNTQTLLMSDDIAVCENTASLGDLMFCFSMEYRHVQGIVGKRVRTTF